MLCNKKIDINVNVYLMNINNEFVSTGTIDPYSGFMTKKSVESTLRAGFESDGRFNINKFNLFYSFQYQLNKLFDSLQIIFDNKEQYTQYDLEVIFSMIFKDDFTLIDHLGLTQNISVWNDKSCI